MTFSIFAFRYHKDLDHGWFTISEMFVRYGEEAWITFRQLIGHKWFPDHKTIDPINVKSGFCNDLNAVIDIYVQI